MNPHDSHKEGSEQTASSPAATPPPATPSTDHTLLFGILAYLSILVVIPLLVAKDDQFVQFHVRQGLVLCVAWVGMWAVSVVMPGLVTLLFAPISALLTVGLIVLSIIGIINVVKRQEKPLPLVGKFAKHFVR
jgi:uncharacterized membrane protein